MPHGEDCSILSMPHGEDSSILTMPMRFLNPRALLSTLVFLLAFVFFQKGPIFLPFTVPFYYTLWNPFVIVRLLFHPKPMFKLILLFTALEIWFSPNLSRCFALNAQYFVYLQSIKKQRLVNLILTLNVISKLLLHDSFEFYTSCSTWLLYYWLPLLLLWTCFTFILFSFHPASCYWWFKNPHRWTASRDPDFLGTVTVTPHLL